MNRYRCDVAQTNEHGQTAYYARWLGGHTLAKVRNAVCPDGTRRMAYATGEPDSYFSIPARIRVRGTIARGFLSLEDGRWLFTPTDPATLYVCTPPLASLFRVLWHADGGYPSTGPWGYRAACGWERLGL